MFFAAGDVVRLKSGGPTMTVRQIYSEEDIEYAMCSRVEKTTKKTDGFATVLLEPAAPKAAIGVLKTSGLR